jgi:hypothetical protein
MTNLLEKNAQVLPGLPDDFPIAPKTPTTPTLPEDYPTPANTSQGRPINAPPTTTSPTSNVVMKMQEAMASFYDTLKTYKLFSQLPHETENATKNPQGSDTFLTFMLNRYINKSDTIGKQDMSFKEGTKPFDLTKLIDTFNSFANGNRPDGKWGPMTNNALKNIYAFIQAMMSMMKKVGVNQEVFTDKDLETLKAGIPANPNKISNQEEMASNIAKLLTQAKKLIGIFVDTVNSKFGDYINKNKSFNIGLSKTSYKSIENNQAPLNVSLPIDIATPSGKTSSPLLLGHLASKDAFDNFVKMNNLTVGGQSPLNNPDLMRKLVDYIEGQVKEANQSKSIGTEY